MAILTLVFSFVSGVICEGISAGSEVHIQMLLSLPIYKTPTKLPSAATYASAIRVWYASGSVAK